MPYIVNTFNGQQIAVVNDGTIDQTLDIKLIGRNYAGFGEILNENLVHMLENFAGSSSPTNAIPGQIWYDSNTKVLKFYDGNQFRVAGGAEVGTAQPTGLAKGDFWWEEDGEQLYVFNGEDFILVGPVATGGEGVSQVTSAVVKDVLGNNRTILKVTVQDQVINIVSKDEFTLDNSINPITGFSAIKKGLNLASKTTFPGMRYWGTAEDADNLGGIPASQYILNSGLQRFSDEVSFLNDNGILIGAGSDIRIHITSGDEGNLTNQVGNVLRFNVNAIGTGAQNVARFESTNFIPGTDGTGSIGTITNKWGQGYFNSINIDANGKLTGNVEGDVTGNVTGNTTGTHYGNVNSTTGLSTLRDLTVTGILTANLSGTSTTAQKLIVDGGAGVVATVAATPSTIPARDVSGDIYANIFQGTATNSQALSNFAPDKAEIVVVGDTVPVRTAAGDIYARKFNGTATAAQYADLAEIYASDKDYEPGTVVIIGGSEEVTESTYHLDHRLAGVVSTAPAYLMNSKADGVAVALRGRVPCKVEGKVQKGDILVTGSKPGTAVALAEGSSIPNAVYIVGKSLETSRDDGIKLVEILV